MSILEIIKMLANGLSYSLEEGLVFTIDFKNSDGDLYDLPVKSTPVA